MIYTIPAWAFHRDGSVSRWLAPHGCTVDAITIIGPGTVTLCDVEGRTLYSGRGDVLPEPICPHHMIVTGAFDAVQIEAEET